MTSSVEDSVKDDDDDDEAETWLDDSVEQC